MEGKPQILEHASESLPLTLHDTRQGAGLALRAEARGESALHSGTFGASSLADRHLAAGDAAGRLQLWDLERLAAPFASVQAHASAVNRVDGSGGQADAAVAAFEPASADQARDCWAVAFGDAHCDTERCVAAGYDNGDVKLFCLRTNRLRWGAALGDGVCGLQFDRRDIAMNKLVATCLEGRCHVFDMRTQHPQEGFASTAEGVEKGATLWCVAHLPQNRDVWALTGGDGSVSLYRYRYPDQRFMKVGKGVARGVAGSVERIAERGLSTQPLTALDWSPDKLGLFCCTALDQTLRVGFATKLHLL
ncbi:hypothetical protein WJX81_003592 [Elliptochloris bilobata]|uniref:Uncharacterized protein n=1 Tax=Elliptochloris bilobata TaxID=381761 RepID=A0AAW1RX39_9CHLO